MTWRPMAGIRSRCASLLTLACLAWTSGVRAEEVVEAWRSPFGRARSVSANPTDGSCWAATGSSVMHVAQDGTVLSQTDGFWAPECVAVNANDGSCWVADTHNGQVVHLAEDGAELWRGGGFRSPDSVSVNPTDGSCWVADCENDQIVHLAQDGAELWRGGGFNDPCSVSVNPRDNSCWVADSGNAQTVHLAEDGAELWRGGVFSRPSAVSVSLSDGSCWVADAGRRQVIHIGEHGAELWRAGIAAQSVSADPTDGSCWMADPWHHRLVHVAEDGTELWQGQGFDHPSSVSVNPTDGSCWVAGRYAVIHLAEDGTELWRGAGYYGPESVSADPVDGSCWVAHGDWVAHLDEDGRKLGEGSVYSSGWGAGSGSGLVARHAEHVGALSISMRMYYPFRPQRVSVSPADGSCWAAGTSDSEYAGPVVHLATDGKRLWQGRVIYWPQGVSVNPADGSCWVYEVIYGVLERGVAQIVHLAEDGSLLYAGGSFHEYGTIAVNPRDGSCWVVEGGFVSVNATDGSGWVADTLHGRVLRLAEDHTELWRRDGFSAPMSVCANSADGSGWVADTGRNQVALVGADGTEIWRAGGFDSPVSVSVNPSDGSCWVADTGNGQVVHLVIPGWRPPVFYDVPPYSWAFEEVEACSREGIVSGYPDGLYHPSVAVSRDQAAVVIARALAGGDSAVPDGPRTPSFIDVPPSHWAYKHIEYAKSRGVVRGYARRFGSLGIFYLPSLAVPRDQMAVLISRAVAGGEDKVPDGPTEATFSDVPTDHWAYKYIEHCAAEGIVQGYDGVTYGPTVTVSRDQMAVYVARAFRLPA